MRPPLRQKLLALVGDATVSDEDPDDIARKLMVQRFGPQCAAWLMFEHRGQLHRTGAIDFLIPRLSRSRLPMWFALAMRYLETSAGFEVERRENMRHLMWRVKWKSRGYWRELRARMHAPS